MRHRSFAVAAVLAAAMATASPAAWAQKVTMSTSLGDVVLELDAAKAPKSVDNFVQYVNAGHYNGTVFHRVIENFMIQGGGFSTEMKEKSTRAPIGLESKNGLTNQRGTIAMARTMYSAKSSRAWTSLTRSARSKPATRVRFKTFPSSRS